MSEQMMNEESGCFGCGQANERGLQLAFEVVGVGEVETHYVVPAHFAGAPGVVHGGVQAALLDEAIGFAIHAGGGEDLNIVTAEFSLRYRRPVPSDAPLRIRGRLLRHEGRDFYAEGEILSREGEALTRATARWRRVDPPA